MPKETFFRLNIVKQKLIMDAFYYEFSVKHYDEASISNVVKKLGIAKGSIYQYFDNKLDLYLFLLKNAGERKAEVLNGVERNDYDDFWSYMLGIYEKGLEFDKLYFLESHFLHGSRKSSELPSVKEMFKHWDQMISNEFLKMVEFEKGLQLFHNKIDSAKMSFFLHTNLKAMSDYLEMFHGLDIEENINNSQGVYSGISNEKHIGAVHEVFSLIRMMFDVK